MEQLPLYHPKRPVRDCGPSTPSPPLHAPIFHSPLNSQVSVSRSIQNGTFRGPDIKSPVRIVDGRVDQVERNRGNIFYDSLPDASTRRSFSPPPGTRLTSRHEHTPYDYNTMWISQPDRNTSSYGAPNETFQTSYMKCPVSDQDKIRNSTIVSARYAALRHNQAHFLEYVDQCDQKKKSIVEMNTRNIRRQRADFMDTLNIRKEKEWQRMFK